MLSNTAVKSHFIDGSYFYLYEPRIIVGTFVVFAVARIGRKPWIVVKCFQKVLSKAEQDRATVFHPSKE